MKNNYLPKTKKSVLLVGNFLNNSFCDLSVSEKLAARLADADWNVITTSTKWGRLARLIDMVTTTWSERHWYSVAHIDVFSGWSFFWAEAVCWMLRRVGKSYILTLRGGGLPTFARYRQRRVQSLLCSAAAVTTPSRYLLEQMNIYCDNMQLIPNPIDLNTYSFSLRKRPQPRLVWLRAFHEIYNPSLAPEVVAELSKYYSDIQLIMAGRDKGDGSFQKTKHLSTVLGVTKQIAFPGLIPREEISSWINKGDIFLNTTNVDNTPISVLEAMACGLCVISTNVGGIPYLLENEKDALLVPPDDSEAMVAAVNRILTDSDLAKKLSQNARAKVEQFDWAIVLPQWKSLLKSVAESGKL